MTFETNPDHLVESALNDLCDFRDRTFRLVHDHIEAHNFREYIREYLEKNHTLPEHWINFFGSALEAIRAEEAFREEMVAEQIKAREDKMRQQSEKQDIDF